MSDDVILNRMDDHERSGLMKASYEVRPGPEHFIYRLAETVRGLHRAGVAETGSGVG